MSEIADMQIVNFTVSNVDYGVPVEQVMEVRDIQAVTPLPGAPSYVDGVTNLRGKLITVIDLQKRLELKDIENPRNKIIVISTSEHTVGVVVDSVMEVSTIAGSEIETKMDFATIYGNYVIGVGKQEEKIVVILDLDNIVKETKIESGKK